MVTLQSSSFQVVLDGMAQGAEIRAGSGWQGLPDKELVLGP
jgi:hypothetical protein